MFDTIIIGGGIVGSSIGYHLSEEDQNVLLIDRDDSGRATTAGAGIISPETSPRPKEWFDVAIEAKKYFPELVGELRSKQDADTGYTESGIIHVPKSEKESEEVKEIKELLTDRLSRIDSPHIGNLESTVKHDHGTSVPIDLPNNSYYYKEAARLKGDVFARALRRAASDQLSTINADAEYILTDQNGEVSVVTDEGDFFAKSVVVAGGAWSPSFSDQLGVTIPVQPKQGQIIHATIEEGNILDWPIMADVHNKYYIIPWSENRLALGATRNEEAGFDTSSTLGGVQTVLHSLLEIAPTISNAELEEVRVGLRPVSRDNLPILGPIPSDENVFLATGHGASGLQLGPYSGKLIADAIVQNTTDYLPPYVLPTRFE